MASPTPTAASPQRIGAMQAAAKMGIAYTPGMANPATIAPTTTPPAASGYTPQTYDVSSIYKPLQANLDAQKAMTSQRYANNQADIKNIFGSLSTIRAQDAAKIADQFKASLTQQQNAVASRNAAASLATQAGAQGAQAAGAELGAGPVGAPTDSLSAQAAAQGAATSNALETNWEGLQGAMQGQTQQNLQNAISGYGFQQAQAVQDLGKAFQDKMMGLDTQGADLQSQIAQADISQKQAINSNMYDQYAKGLEMQNARDIASGNNQATLGAAQARAQGTIGAATISANAKKVASTIAASKSAGKTSTAAKISSDPTVQSAATAAYNAAFEKLNPNGSTRVIRPTAADVKALLPGVLARSPQKLGKISPQIMDYIASIYTK